MKVTREPGPTTHYRPHDDGERHFSLHHREVQALVATRAGMVRARWRHVRAPYFDDHYIEAECDVYGIGRGTLHDLQRRGYLTKPDDDGPIALTSVGDEVLDAILALDGARQMVGVPA